MSAHNSEPQPASVHLSEIPDIYDRANFADIETPQPFPFPHTTNCGDIFSAQVNAHNAGHIDLGQETLFIRSHNFFQASLNYDKYQVHIC